MNLRKNVPVIALTCAILSGSAFAYTDGNGYAPQAAQTASVSTATPGTPHWNSTRGYAAVGLGVVGAVASASIGQTALAAAFVGIAAAGVAYDGGVKPHTSTDQQGW